MTSITKDMNSSVGEDYNIQQLCIHVAAGITITAGMMTDGFIVAVNVTDWIKRRPVAITDRVLTTLGITRMLYQSVCLLDIFLRNFFIELCIVYKIVVNSFLAMFFYASIWLSNLLAVVFSLKICNFHSVFFLRLKTIILQRVIHLIIASVLVSICYSSSYYLITTIGISENSSNKTNNWVKDDIEVYMFLFWNILPFLMFLISSVLLISYLCHHMNMMRCDRTVTGQLDAYYKTIKFSALSFLNYAFYFITHVTIFFYKGSLDNVGFNFVLNIFPTLHSIYLIYITAKLRNRFFELAQHVSKCLYKLRH